MTYCFIGKDFDYGKDWKQEEKGTREDERVGRHQMNMSLNKFREMVKDREAWRDTVHGVEKSRTRLSYGQQLLINHIQFKTYAIEISVKLLGS